MAGCDVRKFVTAHAWRFSRYKEDRLQTRETNIQPKKDCLLRGTNWILEFYCDDLTASGPLAEGFVVHIVAGSHVSLPVLQFAPFSIISPTLHAHLHINVTLIKRTSGRRPGNFPKSNALSEIRQHWIEKVWSTYCYRFYLILKCTRTATAFWLESTCDPPCRPITQHRGVLPEGKAAGLWSWPLISIRYRDLKMDGAIGLPASHLCLYGAHKDNFTCVLLVSLLLSSITV